MPAPTSRLRSYALLAVGALAGGFCGALFDQGTATISPEYFLVGKQLADSPMPFRMAVAWTGFGGGLSIGAAVVGGGLLRRRRASDFSWSNWLKQVTLLFGVGLLFAP